jgi:putative endonuclease
LYTGVTNDLIRRIDEHKNGTGSKFTSHYRVHKLVYFESTESVESAIRREKQIKGWSRTKKVSLIESVNPEWKDLSDEL